jgi:hypothetical protein
MTEGPDDRKGKRYTRGTSLPPGNVLSFKPKPQRRIVLSLSEFLAQYRPPDYLVDRLLQRGYFYSLTGPTGAGKTAIAILLSILVSRPAGHKLGPHDVEHGRVLYITKENPTDVRMRLIGAAAQMGFDADSLEFLVLEEIRTVDKKVVHQIAEEVAAFGDLALVIVDTSVALFSGEEENSNTQIGKHARAQRELTKLPGRPCVVTLCHPIKNAVGKDNMIPRGGGAFLAEVDGNLCVVPGDDRLVDLHWTGKLRGPDFDRIVFRLNTMMTTNLMDTKGRILPTVMAEVVTQDQVDAAEDKAIFEETVLLKAMADSPNGSLADWAQVCRSTTDAPPWLSPIKAKDKAEIDKSKSRVRRVLDRLVKQRLVVHEGRTYVLRKTAKKADEARRARQVDDETV